MAVDMFLKIDGIDGESTKSKAEGWIEILSFSNGVSNTSSAAHGTGMGTGKADVSSITIQKIVDKASPLLFLNCCGGNHIKKTQLQVRETTGGNTTETYFQYDLENVLIDSVSWGGSAGGGKPSESVSLSFQKITVSYWPQNADGKLGSKIPAGWDVSKNVKV
jgi:type VI secretion system secreted protein Hcp